MKHFSLLFFLLPFFSFAQEFTLPDSAAIISTQVKSVKIYYTGTGSSHLISGEFRYDKKGRNVYHRPGSASYYYSKEYNSENLCIRVVQRDMNAKAIKVNAMDYFPDGKRHHLFVYDIKDTTFPSSAFEYDENGKETEWLFYKDHKLWDAEFFYYDASGKLISKKDSLAGHWVNVNDPVHLVSSSVLDSTGEKGHWTFTYNEYGWVSKSVYAEKNKPSRVYEISYTRDGKIAGIYLDGKTASEKEKEAWMIKWSGLLPVADENPLPYSDPVSNPQYIHTLKRDKNGNIKEDVITRAESWIKEEPVKYEYEYEYW